MSGAQPKAGNIAGCITVCAEINPGAAQKRFSQGWVDELIDDLNQLVVRVRQAQQNRETISLAYLGNVVEVWEEFEYRFQNVHEEFYQNLKKKFPDLTPAEIKLAAFLRLNMNTKEIASITNQSVNSLETARYRLRKKLGITNQEVNLVNFLLDI